MAPDSVAPAPSAGFECSEPTWPSGFGNDLGRLFSAVRQKMFGGSQLCVYCGRQVHENPTRGQGRRKVHRSYLLEKSRHISGTTRFWVLCCRSCVESKSGLTLREWATAHPVGDHRRVLLERLIETLLRLGVPEEGISGLGGPSNWELPPLHELSEGLAISLAWSHAAMRLGLGRRDCLTCHLPTNRCHTVSAGAPKSKVEMMLTRGHLLPSRYSGKIRRYWVNQCHRCNRDQADHPIADWYVELLEDGDRRAPLVEELLKALKSIGLKNSELTGRPDGG